MPEERKKKFYKNKYFIISVAIIIIIAGYFSFKDTEEVLPFDFIVAEERDLIQVISVTGKVVPAESVDLSFNLSGKIANIPFDVGDHVSKGQSLASLDTKDAKTSVSSAEIEVQSAKLSLEKLIRQKEDSSLLVTRLKAEDDLKKSYKEVFNLLSLIFSDVPTEIKNLEDYYETETNENQGDIDYYAKTVAIYEPIPYNKKGFELAYKPAKEKIEKSFLSYQLLNINSSYDAIDELLDESSEAVNIASKIIRESRDITELYLQTLADESLTPSLISEATTESQLSDLSSLSTKLENYIVSLLDYEQTIRDQKESIVDIDIDTEFQELVVLQKENSLQSAKNNLADHYIISPFTGTVTAIPGKIGATVGSSQTVISLISGDALEIEVNVPEVDIAKTKIGDSAEIILDAYGQDIVFNAEVVKIDPVAVVIDGVATYSVTLIFKEEYEQIKPGMTADIDILSASLINVLAVPSRSVIRRNGSQYVEIFGEDGEIREVLVVTGLRSSDGYVQITEGLKAGDKVITFYK